MQPKFSTFLTLYLQRVFAKTRILVKMVVSVSLPQLQMEAIGVDVPQDTLASTVRQVSMNIS